MKLTLTMCLLFLTNLHSEIFEHAIPLCINFPDETTPMHAIEACIKDLEVAKCI